MGKDMFRGWATRHGKGVRVAFSCSTMLLGLERIQDDSASVDCLEDIQ